MSRILGKRREHRETQDVGHLARRAQPIIKCLQSQHDAAAEQQREQQRGAADQLLARLGRISDKVGAAITAAAEIFCALRFASMRDSW